MVLCWSSGEPLKKNTNSSDDDDDDCKRGGQRLLPSFLLQNVRRRRPSVVDIDLSHYALLDAPETFAVDAKALETTMKGLQKNSTGRFAGRRKTREATEDRSAEKESRRR